MNDLLPETTANTLMKSNMNSTSTATTHPLISFDELGKIRLLPPGLHDASDKLKDECRDFNQSYAYPSLKRFLLGMGLAAFSID
jgi:hypothetical protein